jgi:hypothetical protein
VPREILKKKNQEKRPKKQPAYIEGRKAQEMASVSVSS